MRRNDLTQLLATLRKYNKLSCISKVTCCYGHYFITLSASKINNYDNESDFYISEWLRDNTRMLIGENGMFLSASHMIIYVK